MVIDHDYTLPQAPPKYTKALERWFANNQRDLPWRVRVRSKRARGYRTLVAEFMLQQTQVSRVVERFSLFLQRFPTVETLADATENDVMSVWQGLGYYRRARNLQAAAQVIVKEFGGVVPETVDELMRLPGVGRYTAGAIASIAYNQAEPIVDGNVARVFARLCLIDQPLDGKGEQTFLWELAHLLVNDCDRPSQFNQSLMELGALVCTPKNAHCDSCPLNELCEARSANRVQDIPIPKKATAQVDVYAAAVVIRNSRKQCILTQRPAQGLWGSLWQVPTLETSLPAKANDIAQFVKRATGLIVHSNAQSHLEKVNQFVHHTTHRKMHFAVWAVQQYAARRNQSCEWVSANNLDGHHPVSNAQRRILAHSSAFGGSIESKK